MAWPRKDDEELPFHVVNSGSMTASGSGTGLSFDVCVRVTGTSKASLEHLLRQMKRSLFEATGACTLSQGSCFGVLHWEIALRATETVTASIALPVRQLVAASHEL